jgi:hypothetical protein
MERYPGRLLNLDANAKTVKGQAKGFKTAILYLAPVKLSGFQVCPMASKGCAAACLNTAGRAGVFKAIERARIAKTQFYFRNRDAFMAQLIGEITRFVAKTRREGFEPVVRLNGTSDILWERVTISRETLLAAFPKMPAMVIQDYANIMALFPDVTFYDYTKHIPSKRANLPANYSLTYSYSDDPAAADRSAEALAMGWNVAAVFRNALPETFMGHPVVNGDESDLRFADDRGVVVGLKAKGKAKADTTGFVVD